MSFPYKSSGFFYTLICGLCVLSFSSQAEQFESVGEYDIHYNALNTMMIPATVAKSYKIVRSKNRGMLNIAVRKKARIKPPLTVRSQQK